MRRQITVRTVTGVGAALLLAAASSASFAGSGDAKAGPPAPASPLQRISHAVLHPFGIGDEFEAEPFRLPSKYYGPWQPTEMFGHDARCAPTPFAPRGYGFPKKLSPFRMEYTPYRLQDCGTESIHGPSLWWRYHREPCCGASGCCCRHCDREVDPQ